MKRVANAYVEQIRQPILVMVLDNGTLHSYRWNVAVDIFHQSVPSSESSIDTISVGDWIRKLLHQKILKSSPVELPFSNVLEIERTDLGYVIDILHRILSTRLDPSVNIEIEINESI